MTDILADARRWLAEQPQRVQTHSEVCHNWHVECLVRRLCARIDALSGTTQRTAADPHKTSKEEHARISYR